MLRVDDGRAGGSFTSRNCANPSPQYLLHPFPGAVISPLRKYRQTVPQGGKRRGIPP